MVKPTIYTVGHSDLPIDVFIAELKKNGIEQLIDVRKPAGSNTFLQFNDTKLGEELREAEIEYASIPRLAGHRPKDPNIDPQVNALWTNQSFHNYADYATTLPFGLGLDTLECVAAIAPTAIMCVEAVWWRCHRRIIADHLIAHGYPVEHIMDGGDVDNARLTPGAKVSGRSITYPSDDNREVRQPPQDSRESPKPTSDIEWIVEGLMFRNPRMTREQAVEEAKYADDF